MKTFDTCWYCGDEIKNRRRGARFCNDSHKAAYCVLPPDEKIRRKTLYGSPETDLTYKPEAKTTKQNNITKSFNVDEQKLEPFSNTVSSNSSEIESPLEGNVIEDNSHMNEGKNAEPINSSDARQESLPNKFIVTHVTVDNPEYLDLQSKIKICRKNILRHDSAIIRLKNLLEIERNKNYSSSVFGHKSIVKIKKDLESVRIKTIMRFNVSIFFRQTEIFELRTTERKLNFKLRNTENKIVKEIKKLNPAYEIALRNKDDLLGTDCNKKSNTNNKEKITSAKNISNMNFQLLDFTEKWELFLGKPQTNFFALIHGMSGGGKSHLALQFIVSLCKRFGSGLYISAEEGFAPTFQQKLKKLEADKILNLDIADIRQGEEILKSVPNKYHFIFIDSLNTMGIDVVMMRAIRAKFPDSAIICICQNTKSGELRGSNELKHDSDIVISVNNGTAITTKNRFKETGMEFNVFDVYKNKIDR